MALNAPMAQRPTLPLTLSMLLTPVSPLLPRLAWLAWLPRLAWLHRLALAPRQCACRDWPRRLPRHAPTRGGWR